MFMKLFLLSLFMFPTFPATSPTYGPAGPNASSIIATLRREIVSHRPGAVKKFWESVRKSGTPLIEPIPGNKDFSLVTFLWRGNSGTRNVVIFDGPARFNRGARMIRLDHSDVWYKTFRVRNDALFPYYLSPNDSLVPFNDIKGFAPMEKRLAMLRTDPLNPHRCPATFGSHRALASYIALPDARPLLWHKPPPSAPKGQVTTTIFQSRTMKQAEKLWIYTPPGFSGSGKRYPLLVVFDGDRYVMWLPQIVDDLIAARRIRPVVAVMIKTFRHRASTLGCNPQYANFLSRELVPWARKKYHAGLHAAETIVLGSSLGGVEAVCAGMKHSDVFGNVVSLSGAFWWKDEETVRLVQKARTLPLRFYMTFGLMEGSMMIVPNRKMRDVLAAKGYPVNYSEYDGCHSYLNWSGGVTRALLWLDGMEARNAEPSQRSHTAESRHKRSFPAAKSAELSAK